MDRAVLSGPSDLGTEETCLDDAWREDRNRVRLGEVSPQELPRRLPSPHGVTAAVASGASRNGRGRPRTGDPAWLEGLGSGVASGDAAG